MDYSKIQNGMESIIEALKESNGVDYNGMSDMLHGQNDILKNWFQNTFSMDMRDGMKKAIEASTGQGQAEATTDLVKSVKVVAEFKAHLEDLNLGSIESLSDKLDDLTATLSRTDLEELNSDINTLTKVCTDNRADIARVHDSMNAQFDTLGIHTHDDLFKRLDNVGETIDAQYHETHRMLMVIMERLNSIEDTQIATDQKALEEKLESIEPDEEISTERAILNLESRIHLLESWVCSLSKDCDNYKERIEFLESVDAS